MLPGHFAFAACLSAGAAWSLLLAVVSVLPALFKSLLAPLQVLATPDPQLLTRMYRVALLQHQHATAAAAQELRPLLAQACLTLRVVNESFIRSALVPCTHPLVCLWQA